MAATFDTLKLARALRDKAGFTQEHAEAAADALAEVIGDQVATKKDIADLRTEITALRTEMAAGFRDVEQRMTIRLGGMLVVVTGILLAAKVFG